MFHHQQFPSDDASKKTLWMGELDPWLDESAIKNIWAAYGETVNVKLIREKFTGSTAGYCFVEFSSPSAASKALTLNGQPIQKSQRFFKLNWASGGGLADSKRDEKSPEFSIFVGDLASEVTEFQLLQLFQYRYPSCKSAKIMTDPQTNASRGYGFVRFSDEGDMQRALTEMQGYFCGPRPMRISTATPKAKVGATATANPTTTTTIPTTAGTNINPANASVVPGISSQLQAQSGSIPSSTAAFPLQNLPAQGQSLVSNDLLFPNQQTYYSNGSLTQPLNSNSVAPSSGTLPPSQPINQFTDPNNTTVFVGGLSSSVTEDELRCYFSGFGDITYVKIPSGKGCGFVQYVQRSSAEEAITKMQGYPIGNSRVRLSWGRSQNNAPNNNLANNTGSKSLEIATSSLNPMGVNMSLNMNQMGINHPMNINSSNIPSTSNAMMNIPSNLLSGPYVPAATAPVYPQMTVPPQQSFGPFSQVNPQLAHMHPPQPLPSSSSSSSTSSLVATSSDVSSLPTADLHGLPPQVGAGVGPNSAGLVNSVSGQDPSEPVLVARLNQLYLAARDGRLDRVEAEGRGYHGVYAQ